MSGKIADVVISCFPCCTYVCCSYIWCMYVLVVAISGGDVVATSVVAKSAPSPVRVFCRAAKTPLLPPSRHNCIASQASLSPFSSAFCSPRPSSPFPSAYDFTLCFFPTWRRKRNAAAFLPCSPPPFPGEICRPQTEWKREREKWGLDIKVWMIMFMDTYLTVPFGVIWSNQHSNDHQTCLQSLLPFWCRTSRSVRGRGRRRR